MTPAMAAQIGSPFVPTRRHRATVRRQPPPLDFIESKNAWTRRTGPIRLICMIFSQSSSP
jgi:hypothetical protein